MTFFHDLLHQVGAALNLPQPLEPNNRESCTLEVEPGLQLFLELDATQENIVVGCPLGEVPPGAYGNRLLLEALKANGATAAAHSGILAYSTLSHQLVLFEKTPLAKTQANDLIQLVQRIVPRAKQWHAAIETGQIPPTPQATAVGGSGGMFGLVR